MRYVKSFGRFLFLAALVGVVLLLTMGNPGSYQVLIQRLLWRAPANGGYPSAGSYSRRQAYPQSVSTARPDLDSPRLLIPEPVDTSEPNYDPNRPVLRPPIPERVITPADLYGKWGGAEFLPDRGSCQIGMDIEPGIRAVFGVYVIVNCMPTEPSQPRMNPGFTVMAGAFKDGQMDLVPTKTNVTAQHSCVVRALALLPSRNDPDKMLATWTDSCSSGTMHIKRVR